MKHDLRLVFEPQSAAVIGASELPGSIGNSIFSNILHSGFNGPVYPVNPKYKSVLSVRAYNNITAIPDAVDLAVLCIPAPVVEDVLLQCALKKVKGVVIITAGFKEVGEEGKKLENRLVETAIKNDIEIIGPNCLGIVNTAKNIGLNANFAFGMPKAGNIALVSQSGAIGIVAMGYAHQHDLGISKFASIGNKAVIDESDVLEYLIDDELTKIITMYIEDIQDPDRFHAMAHRAARMQKPIIVIKSGTSAKGAIAAHSHTGALSSSDVAYDSLFAQCGVIRVASLNEVFECAKGFTSMKVPKGNRMTVLTNAGGIGIIATDAAEKYGLEMASLRDETKEALKKVLPPTASLGNPVDLTGDSDEERFMKALAIVTKDRNTDALLICITPTVKTDVNKAAKMLVDFAKTVPALTILTNIVSFEPEPAFEDILEKGNIPNFDFPEINVRVLATMMKYYKWIKQPEGKIERYAADTGGVKKILNRIGAEGRNRLTEPESYSVLKAYGINTIKYKLVESAAGAIAAANEIGYPVALKIVSSDIIHKTDVGGVSINLQNDSQVKAAFAEINENIKTKCRECTTSGFVVEEFSTSKGIEIIAGVKAFKGFNHLIMFGLGGSFVEIFKDVSFRLAPLVREDAINMIEEIKGYRILKGYRGQASYDISSIADYLLKLSQLVTDFPEIKEMDLNPIKVLEDGKGLIALDAKISIDTALAEKPAKAAAALKAAK